MNNTKDMVERATFLVDTFRMIILGLAVTIACSGHTYAQSKDGWNYVGQIGASKVVVLDRQSKASVEERVWAALRSICTSSHCNANFLWEHEYASQKGVPERELSKHAILVYSTNYGFQWNCTFRPFADNCFKK
ncbi:hypothetical protein [Sulfuritalea hydrogenivorans]|uniref:Uncharacterized protein n=1 Tax=Sulfuritalea hydrogenivorans sk43H TaxID=1223802 RepID=W0SHZ2_9PROT|nr:hypothetical protein [Sulfuritalea hydrogenivorans]BAO29558.1 hypothetical protein SUTH_01766 [Sulfuritalea hydrogenivorans sk43H]